MNRKTVLYTMVSIVVVLIITYSFQGTGSQDQYVKEVAEKRAETDRFMRNSQSSPFVNDPDKYTGLKYFEPDPMYRINAAFEKLESGRVRLLPTSDGNEQSYREIGWARFELDGRRHQLLVLQEVGLENIFVPFADSTSGDQTYGAGRYLEVVSPDANQIVLDFNYAYNPYCAYSEAYSCPLPPAENFLSISIYAGEKNYE